MRKINKENKTKRLNYICPIFRFATQTFNGAIKANEYRIQESIPPCSLYLFMNPYPVPRYIPVSSARGGDSIAMEIENLIGLPETSAEKHFCQSIHK